MPGASLSLGVRYRDASLNRLQFGYVFGLLGIYKQCIAKRIGAQANVLIAIGPLGQSSDNGRATSNTSLAVICFREIATIELPRIESGSSERLNPFANDPHDSRVINHLNLTGGRQGDNRALQD